MPRPTGFTLLEVLIALLVFSVGALGLAAETAALTRQLARSKRAGRAAAAAAMRLERLQAWACTSRVDGTELVLHGGTAIATLRWTWDAAGTGHEVTLVTSPVPTSAGPAVPADTLQALVSCGS